MDNIIEVPKETIAIGLLFGLMRTSPEDGVHELTPKGEHVLRDYCRRKLAEHRSKMFPNDNDPED